MKSLTLLSLCCNFNIDGKDIAKFVFNENRYDLLEKW